MCQASLLWLRISGTSVTPVALFALGVSVVVVARGLPQAGDLVGGQPGAYVGAGSLAAILATRNANNATAQKMLGHYDFRMTLAIYTHPT